MGFRRSDLQPAFSVPGTYHFTIWGYGTTDTLDEVLRPAYVQGGRTVLSLGDLIYVRTRPHRVRPDEPERGEVRAALVMVSAWDRGNATLRLVQDFGRPDDAGPQAPAGTAPAAPKKRTPPASAPKDAPASAKPKAAPTPPRRFSPAPDPGPEPPVRQRGRPPKNRARLGG